MKNKIPQKTLNIISQYFFPDNAATGQLLYSLAKKLKEKKFNIRVITSYPSYAENRNNEILNENHEGFKIERLFLTKFSFIKKSPKLFKGIIFCLLNTKEILFMNKNLDLIILTSEPLFLPIFGWLLCKLKSINYVLLIYDLYPEILVDMKLIQNDNFINKIWTRLNYKVYKNSKEIIVLSKDIKDKITKKYNIKKKKINIIPSWADTKSLYPVERDENWFIKENNLEGLFIVIYSGNQGRLHDLDTIIETANLLKNESKILFLFVGSGFQNKSLKKKVKSKNLNNCRFLPYQKLDDLKFSLSSASLGVVSVCKNAYENIAPSKLYGYLAVGLPLVIISPEKSYLKEFVEKKELGIWIKNGQSERFAKQIIAIKDSTKVQLDFKKKALEYINNYASLEFISNKYGEILKRYL